MRGPPGSKDWIRALRGCDDVLFIDFLKRCLEWDPVTRLTPPAALRHGWLRRRLPRPPQSNTADPTHRIYLPDSSSLRLPPKTTNGTLSGAGESGATAIDSHTLPNIVSELFEFRLGTDVSESLKVYEDL